MKRLQVLIDEGEYARYLEIAEQRGSSLAEWVRAALRTAARQEPASTVDRKLEAIRSAALHSFPTADIDRMLAEIDRGYGDDPSTSDADVA